MINPLIGLLDCNNFYVSCERVFRPDLQYRPVVVLSNNDGCIIARSNEIKALGIPMGAPYFKIKSLLEANNTAIFSSNFSLYGDLSARIMSILESLAPKIEVYSIDEAFIDFTGIQNPHSLATNIREQILQQVGIPTCVGISLTKTLSKVANRVAKKNASYQGVCVLTKEDQIDVALESMDPADIWGIGRKSSEKLTAASITTALQLKNTDPKWMRKYFTVMGERTIMELNGVACLEIDDIVTPRQSMQVTRTFSGGITELADLREKIASFASRVSEKMRQHGLVTQNVSVYVRTNIFKEKIHQYSNSGSCPLLFPTNDDFTLIEVSTKILESLYRPGFSFHKAGITVHDLMPEKGSGAVQLNLFGDQVTSDSKTKDLMKAMDALNQRFGRGTLNIASCGVHRRRNNNILENKNSLQGHQLRKSPAYTTKWAELPVVK